MPLDRTAAGSALGSELELQPWYGWGWRPTYPWGRTPPPRSRFVLEHLVEFRGEVVGGIGRVTRSSGLPNFGGMWIVFELRVVGDFDFSARVGYFNLVLRTAPSIEPSSLSDAWDSYELLGYGDIGLPGFHSALFEPGGIPSAP